MTGTRSVVVSGVGLAIPGVPSPPALLEAGVSPDRATPIVPEEVLGRRGLRYKDQATRLALCASLRALEDASLADPEARRAGANSFGVVVSSNLANLDTVCRVAATIHAAGVEDTSPMDLPNGSSNEVASSVAIWFGLAAINLTVCSGATAGVDALAEAARAIRAGRAERVLVVGVETDNEVVSRLLRESARGRGLDSDQALLDGAAAVVLSAEGADGRPAAPERVRLRGFGFADTGRDSVARAGAPGARPGLWLVPNQAHPGVARQTAEAAPLWLAPAPGRCLDLSAALGECYGALGVVQCAAACAWLQERPGSAVLTCGGSYGDGYASLVLARSS